MLDELSFSKLLNILHTFMLDKTPALAIIILWICWINKARLCLVHYYVDTLDKSG